MRKNLIKVPSCERHNTEKSKDDLYALWHVASLDGVNKTGESVHKTLFKSAKFDWERRGGAFMKLLASEIYGVEGNRPLGRLDGNRMCNFHILIARGLYFFHFLKRLDLPLKVTNISNDFRDPKKTEELRLREEFFDAEMGDVPI